MFYKMITKKRDEWFSSNRCNIKHLIDYMETTGQLLYYYAQMWQERR